MARLGRKLTPAEVQLVRDIAHETVSWQWSTGRGDPAAVERAVRVLLRAELRNGNRPEWLGSTNKLLGLGSLPVKWVFSPAELNTGHLNPGIETHFDGSMIHERGRSPYKISLCTMEYLPAKASQNEFRERVRGIIAREMILPNAVILQAADQIRVSFSDLRRIVDSRRTSFYGPADLPVFYSENFRKFGIQTWASFLSFHHHFQQVVNLDAMTVRLYFPDRLALNRALVALSAPTDPWYEELASYTQAWETVFRYTSGMSVFGVGDVLDAEKGAVYVSERPWMVRVNQQHLHSAEGRAIEWEDRFGFDSWRGVTVPAWQTSSRLGDRLYQARSTMPPSLRPLMLDRLGWPRLLDSGLIPAATWGPVPDPGNPGSMLKTYAVGPEASGGNGWDAIRAFLVCTNGSAEPDGSHRQYGLQIPWDLRGDPVAAAAWGYGVSKKQYQEIARRT